MPGGTLFVVKWGVSYVGKTNSHGSVLEMGENPLVLHIL
jgi:hypothetical protein